MEQRSGKNKKDNSTLVGCLGCLGLIAVIIIIGTIIFSTPNSKNSSEKQDYTQSNTEVKDAKEEIPNASVIADDKIKQLYSIDNFKVKYSTLRVNRLPDDKNPETGEIYKNLYGVHGEYTWQDRIYHFSMIYSKKNENEYTVVHLTSNLDDSKTINVPLESDN